MLARLLLLAAVVCLAQDDAVISRDFWTPDAVFWGDGRPEPPASPEHVPHGFRCDYRIEVPATGWYELFLIGAGGDFRHDLLVDGETVYDYRATDRADKAGNVWLTAGAHTLRLKRVGRVSFPKRAFKHFELRPANGRPEACVSAAKTLVDVMRVGESYRIEMTGGGGAAPGRYEILCHDLMDAAREPELAATVDFPAGGTPSTRTVEIPCPREGAFTLAARVAGGRELTVSEFPIGPHAVVDVAAKPVPGGAPEPLVQIDCVEQTVNGDPLPDGSFVECNGPTRIAESSAGRYRESHDCTPPAAEVPRTPIQEPRSYSGFSYRLELPELQVPYLLDVEFPDDARRSVTICMNWLDPETGALGKGTGYNGKSYETGGMYPLSGAMQHHRAVVWPQTRMLLLGVLSQQVGQRAAVARITISRFPGDRLPTPAIAAAPGGGRAAIHWYEEAHNWRHLVNIVGAYPPGVVHDFVGLDRWAQLVRYNGFNGISALGVGYQGCFWRTKVLEGYGPEDYDACRLLALICEKYGMYYLPEVFPSQWYLNKVTLPQAAADPQDVRAVSCHGAEQGTGAASMDLNCLHPLVQQLWVDGLGELADKLRDSPAFAGISVRADAWLFRGDFNFPGLNWGYGDWTVTQFQKDTGLVVPDGGIADRADPRRYLARYAFLTGPEHRERWIDWRCRRVFDYHKRLRDRIRGQRDDLYFAIVGDFRCDHVYAQPDGYEQRAREAGVDMKLERTTTGLAIMPYARYGTRYTTSAEQAIHDGFFDPDNVRAGMGSPRAFSGYMTYHELARYWPADLLGIKLDKPGDVPYYCSAVLPAGRKSLEKFAVVLAEQDSAVLRDGGNTDIYGETTLWQAWFAEFESLPAIPFTPLDVARDPVAVWFARTDTGLLFYAVNREQYPLTTVLDVTGAPSVTRLVGGATVPVTAGKLTLTLAPYGLQAYRAPAGAALTGAVTDVPADHIAYVRDRLAFAQTTLRRIEGGKLVDDAMVAAFRTGLETAWDAYRAGHYWRTRVTLRSAPMMRVHEALAALPAGQVITRFPGLMKEVGRNGHFRLIEPMYSAADLAGMTAGDATSEPSLDFNSEWGGQTVLVGAGGVLELDLDIPADGPYTLKLGHVAEAPGVIVGAVGGQSLAVPAVVGTPGVPETTVFPPVTLAAGKARLVLTGAGKWGVYGLKVLPGLRPLPSPTWSVAGPFRSPWGGESRGADAVKASLEADYGPVANPAPDAVYPTDDGRQLRWVQAQGNIAARIDDVGVNMAVRTCSPGYDLNVAKTYVTCDRDRTALLYVPVDWWARAYLNGERLRTNIDPDVEAREGCDFTTHYPRYYAVLPLKKGLNTLLIKQQGGSLGSSFGAYITDAPGIVCTPLPPKP